MPVNTGAELFRAGALLLFVVVVVFFFWSELAKAMMNDDGIEPGKSRFYTVMMCAE